MAPKSLLPEQALAADPAASAWVSASAGTGKTQVLTARVLRLLLAGARPDRLLALTFTKAAAAEMQTRIFETLARWVLEEEDKLTAHLAAIGAPVDEETKTRARRLFADALEVRGGLKVQTLHSFAGSLLSAFPLEAGVAPGFQTLGDRDETRLQHAVLAAAVKSGAADFRADLAGLSVKLAEQGVKKVIATLIKCGLFQRDYGHAVDWRAAVRRTLGIPGMGTNEEILSAAMAEDVFDWRSVGDYAAALAAWGTKTGLRDADTIAGLRRLPPTERAAALIRLAFKANGEELQPSKRGDPGFRAVYDRFVACVRPLRDLACNLEVAEAAAVHLRVGQYLAVAYAGAKHSLGALDYDDLIDRAARLFADFDAAFVLYKLDQRIDHILVDEGQDTNARQWAIINAIADEFFAGSGAREEHRTLFAVGDYKQAIFGFQGTDPAEYEKARATAEQRIAAAGERLRKVELNRSFRSVEAVLDVVDQVIADAGHEAFGVDDAISRHVPDRAGQPGEVVLWPPVLGALDEEDEGASPDAERELARRIAGEIAGWIAAGERLLAHDRPIAPGDVLILVRSRGNLVPALVAALHRANVPVAGADRLQLAAPIAVKDLLALARFALQPGDDLSLAALLVSPLIGWSQEDVFELAYNRGQKTLWRALRETASDKAVAARDWLDQVLAGADYLPPYEFFDNILSGPLQARALLLARLGEEARDPIDEVLNQALLFEATNTPSLQAFLQWIDSDEVEIKRDPDAPHNAVRIMTVHGAKGLQAPIVILADAVKSAPKQIKPPLMINLAGIGDAPVFYGRKENLTGAAKAAYDKQTRAEAEETMRLLYVAMTRAEDRLYVAGARGKKEPPAGNWHARIEAALRALGADEEERAPWGQVVCYRKGERAAAQPADAPRAAPPPRPLPDWAMRIAPEEERPPRPLAPSSDTGDEDVAFPPPGPASRSAARRGAVLHQLFERIGSIRDENREAAARAWLQRNASDLDADPLLAELFAVLQLPEAAAFFAPDALAEAPLCAIVGDRIVTGVMDRLVLRDDQVAALDFKTGARVPAALADIPTAHRRQMQSYAAALAKIYPERKIVCALLYTAEPRLFVLDEAGLAGG